MGMVVSNDELEVRRYNKCQALGRAYMSATQRTQSEERSEEHESPLAAMRDPHVTSGYCSIIDAIRYLFGNRLDSENSDRTE